MSKARNLHRRAMSLVDEAQRAALRGEHEAEGLLRAQALDLEERAAALLAERYDLEPTRAILFKSAAVLALRCGEMRRAERLVASALAGEPPEDAADELRGLLEQVNCERHLALRGIQLLPDECQISLVGDAVGQGFASKDEVLDRLEATEKLLVRTAERKRAYPFRQHGRPSREIRSRFQLFVSPPRAGSFALTIKLGAPERQLQLPGLDDTAAVVEETLTCLELFEKGEEDGLRQRIADSDYYQNFLGLAREIAPDGKAVRQVGFTSSHEGHERRVSITRPKQEVTVGTSASSKRKLDASTPVRVAGELRRADSTTPRRKSVLVVDEKGERHKLLVPDAIMSDVVRPYYEEWVTVTATKTKRGLELVLIDRADRQDTG